MCGRYRTSEDEGWADLRITPYLPELFAIRNDDVRPTDVMPVLAGGKAWHVDRMRWGFVPRWGRDRKPVINARVEGLFYSRYFADAARRHRGVVATTGFYEWQKQPVGPKLRFTITRRDHTPLLLGCIYEPGSGVLAPSYAIITCPSNAQVRSIHDRMPLVLEEDDLDRWLDPAPHEEDELADLLVPAADDVLAATPDAPVRRGGGQLSLF